MNTKPIAVVALGGNALSGPGSDGSIEDMRQAVCKALSALLGLKEQSYGLILTHGNGPQVGAQLLRNDAGRSVYGIPAYPLDVLVAETQGQIGYLLEMCWRQLVAGRGLDARVAGLLTMIEVDPGDPAFRNPVKRVGKTYYDPNEVEALRREKHWQFLPETKNGRKGWRRVVPSPVPRRVVNADVIRQLASAGFDIIAGGGGGIPVVRTETNRLEGVEAVIDKDHTSALLADVTGAERFIILTDVPYVYLHYGTPEQTALEILSTAETERLMAGGHFGNGNMLPKIQAALQFTRRTGRESLITDFDGLHRRKGTRIVP